MVSKGSIQHDERQGSTDAADGEYRCGLCKKGYSRRDLRERHRRRCAKTFGQERTSKRKSCDACVQTKLRCSLARPACSRCVQMGIDCHYPCPKPKTSTTSSTFSTHADQEATSEIPWDLNQQPIPTTLPLAVPVSAITLPRDVIANATNMDNTTWSPSLDNIGFILDGTGFPDPALNFVDHLQDHTSFIFTPQEKTNLLHHLDDHSLPLLADQLDVALPPLSSSSGGSNQDSPARRDDVASDKPPAFASSFVRDLSYLALQDTNSLSHEISGILREYPRLMLQSDFWSPFIHHQLYRCSKGGIAEPLGIALACVSAYSGSVESSFEFVENMINSQRERLVHDFHLYSDRPETCLAALNAVCMYQIIGLFGGLSSDSVGSGQSTPFKEGNERHCKESGKAAELYGSFLLKMTRRICTLHPKALRKSEASWTEWKFAESLRRTVFFVHIINILAAEVRKLHHDYFEPLDDATILQMPLPAPENMWRACSDAEWRTAREHARLTTCTPATLQGLIDLDRAGSLESSHLQQLTKIILACHMIQPRFNDEEEDNDDVGDNMTSL